MPTVTRFPIKTPGPTVLSAVRTFGLSQLSLWPALFWAVLLWPSWAGAQPPQRPSATPAAASTMVDEASVATSGRRMIQPQVQPPTLRERFDGAFAKAVDYLSRVLFYRIGAHQRKYVQFQQEEDYYREPGSNAPFTALNPVEDAPQQLDRNQVNRLQALGRLVLDRGRSVRQGTLEGRAVEYVTLQVNSNKYVFRHGDYHRLLPTREQISDEDYLTAGVVAAHAQLGHLKLDEAKVAAGAAEPYVHREAAGGAPLVVVWLSLGAVFFTLYMRGYNIWGFRHALAIVRGKYDNPDEPGEVTHFQALASALSATVGLGNIAGVTIAMATGGPGAFFWMMACGVFGMTSKFVECTLGQKYRQVKPDGTVLGGPMQYLYSGLKELGLGQLGLVLSIIFAVMCILASFGGGNMFQANQSGQQMLAMMQMGRYQQMSQLDQQIRVAAEQSEFDQLSQLQQQKADLQQQIRGFERWFLPLYGIVLAMLVGIVIIGGIKRIGAAAEKVVPTMCVVYVAACLWVILTHVTEIPALAMQIVTEAFTPKAFGGGVLGVLVVGVRRAAFSNEAGVGSAAIAHSAAKTEEPVREGTVALMGPFVDTVVVCSMTALVILITGAWNNEEWVVNQGLEGTPLTSKAFAEEISWFPYVLSIAVVLFAYSTMISWSYYGERCWERLFGLRSTIVYKVIFVTAVFLGSIFNLGAVLDFSDMMILSMAFPNILGLVLLAPKVRRDLIDYWQRYRAGQFQTFK